MQHSTLDELPLLAQFIETAAARFRVYKPDVQLKLGLLVWEMSLREGF
jgi:hypothetical protein